jgi:hypothetical protein
MAGLLAGAAVLEDAALARYVLDGGPWVDRRAGAYTNTSPLRSVIDRAIDEGGLLWEEKIGRDPPIGYALFHLEAMTLAARIAELHFGEDAWTWRGADGAGMIDAFERYAGFVSGERALPPEQYTPMNARWLFALSPPGFGGDARDRLIAADALPTRMPHAIGPVALLFGERE